jgi:uroporphyrinogen decarboxylase
MEEEAMAMTSRERVLCALNHEEPDRVPIFFGVSGATTMLAPAYDRFKSYLGVSGEPKLISSLLQYARLDEEVMLRFGVDGRPIQPGPAPSSLRRAIDERTYVDEWGVTWQMKPGTLYFEIVDSPLRDATIADLDRYSWPDLAHPGRFTGLAAEAAALHGRGLAAVGLSGVNPVEQIWSLRGFDTWLIDLALDPEFAHALLGKVTDLMLAGVQAFLGEVGTELDVVITADDQASQRGPLISPKMYREMIKPYHARLIAGIKQKTRAKVFFHSDGNVFPLIRDFIDIGVDLLNPVQVSAHEMGDTARLKRMFGDELSFCGGIDTQAALPFGTTDDVRREVRRRIRDLGPGGGYILAAVHCIQPDVPPENVCAMLDEAAIAGSYPLQH